MLYPAMEQGRAAAVRFLRGYRCGFVVVALCIAVTTGSTGGIGASVELSALAGCSVPEGQLPGEVADVRSFGARGNGVDDDTTAIVNAIQSLTSGGTVIFPPGTYVHSTVISVRNPDVALIGHQAVLHASNAYRASVILAGENESVSGFKLTTAPGKRVGSSQQSAILLTGRGGSVFGNTAVGFGIMIEGARDYLIACNNVLNSLADGIHSTEGALNGVVAYNRVSNSGDDGIAVVSYAASRQASNIRIEGNTVDHVRWGRGISVIGSRDVIIRNNRVRYIAMAAGIIVAREAAWHTPGASNVVIESNDVFDVQETLLPEVPGSRTGHAAIEINSDSDIPVLAVSNIEIKDNKLSQSGYDGIRLLGNVCEVSISRNRIFNIKGKCISIMSSCTSGTALKSSDANWVGCE